MRKIVIAAAVLMSLEWVAPSYAFGASFSWAGIAPCGSTSPVFQLKDVPRTTKQLRFQLKDYDAPNFPHGGSTVAYGGSAAMPEGAISYAGPCPPPGERHKYIWIIEALDGTGKVVGRTTATGIFPP